MKQQKNTSKIFLIFLLALLYTGICIYGSNLKITTQKILELGRHGDPFYRLSAVCQDDQENIYILDNKRYNVRKFSKDGKELLSFGGHGEGPSEWQAPRKIYFEKNTGIIVTEMMNFASIFTPEGKLIQKFNFAKKGGLFFYISYLGGDIFYGVSQRGTLTPHQVFFHSSGQKINIDSFASMPVEVKMPNGFTFSETIPEIFPELIFESYNGYGIIGLSNKYELKLLNNQGKLIHIFKRNAAEQPLSKKEKEEYTSQLRSINDFPPPVQQKFIDLIPKNKMLFYTARPTSNYIFVFRIKPDTTTTKPPYPVDVFAITGQFLGEISLSNLPLLITDKYIYSEEGDENNEDDPILLIKTSYQLLK